jgi:hypothetical protein
MNADGEELYDFSVTEGDIESMRRSMRQYEAGECQTVDEVSREIRAMLASMRRDKENGQPK